MADAADDILVVDDEPWVAELLVASLTAAGYTARSVADGPAALAAITERLPALLLLDLMLPGMHGADVLLAMRRRGVSVPVIVTSVLARDVAEQILADYQVTYVPKQAGLSALLAGVAQVVPPPAKP